MERFVVREGVWKETEKFLRGKGEEYVEGWALWAGHEKDDAFVIDVVRFPKQTATAISTVVDQRAIEDFFDEMRPIGRHLAIQIHTHPGEAFHSATDNAYPITTQLGAMSIVVPTFCALGLQGLPECALFRLTRAGWCGPLPRSHVLELVRLDGA